MDSNIITYLACIFFLFIFGRIFIVPITKLLKIVFNSILGGVLIYIINLIGGGFGFHIGLNFFTSILVRNIRYTRSSLYYNNKSVNLISQLTLFYNKFFCLKTTATSTATRGTSTSGRASSR